MSYLRRNGNQDHKKSLSHEQTPQGKLVPILDWYDTLAKPKNPPKLFVLRSDRNNYVHADNFATDYYKDFRFRARSEATVMLPQTACLIASMLKSVRGINLVAEEVR
jgi:hypothetical protein